VLAPKEWRWPRGRAPKERKGRGAREGGDGPRPTPSGGWPEGIDFETPSGEEEELEEEAEEAEDEPATLPPAPPAAASSRPPRVALCPSWGRGAGRASSDAASPGRCGSEEVVFSDDEVEPEEAEMAAETETASEEAV